MVIKLRTRWFGHVAYRYVRNSHKISGYKTWKRKRPLRRPKHKWEDNIKVSLKETGYEDVDQVLTGSVDSPVASCCEHGSASSDSTSDVTLD